MEPGSPALQADSLPSEPPGKSKKTGVGSLSPEEGKGYPLQYSGLENSMDYIVHGVAKSRTESLSLFNQDQVTHRCVSYNNRYHFKPLNFGLGCGLAELL